MAGKDRVSQVADSEVKGSVGSPGFPVERMSGRYHFTIRKKQKSKPIQVKMAPCFHFGAKNSCQMEPLTFYLRDPPPHALWVQG